MDASAFPFLSDVHARLQGRATASPEVRAAVAVLTAAANPARAAALVPGPNESAVLVERLATWALRQVGPEVIADARMVLEGPTVPQDARELVTTPELVAC